MRIKYKEKYDKEYSFALIVSEDRRQIWVWNSRIEQLERLSTQRWEINPFVYDLRSVNDAKKRCKVFFMKDTDWFFLRCRMKRFNDWNLIKLFLEKCE